MPMLQAKNLAITAELGNDYRLDTWNPQVLHPAFLFEVCLQDLVILIKQAHVSQVDLRYWTCDLGHGHSWFCGFLGIMMVGVHEWRVCLNICET